MAFSQKIFNRVTTASALTFAIATQIGISGQGVAMNSSANSQTQTPLLQSLIQPSPQDQPSTSNTLNAYQNVDGQNSCFVALDGMSSETIVEDTAQSCDPDA